MTDEVPNLRTAKSKTFKTSERGRLRTKSSAAPIHFKAADGSWQDIDSKWGRSANGLRNGANSFVADLAGTASPQSIAKVAIDAGHSVGFGLNGVAAAPVAKQPDQAAAAYKGVLPGVDLEFTLKPEGVKEDIVLQSAASPRSFVFPLTLQGLTAELDGEGDVLYRDSTGAVRAVTPRGVMADSSGPGGGAGVSGAVSYELVTTAAGTALKVVADDAFLDDPARVWPVRIDPSLRVGPDRMETYRNGCTAFFADGDVRVGNAMACGNSHWRTVAHFDYDSLFGKNLLAASVHLTGLTGGATVNGYYTYISQATQWGWSCKGTDSTSAAAGEYEQHFYNGRIFSIYDAAINNRTANNSLCLVGTETGGLYTYKHFSTVQLWLDWEEVNRAPNTPDGRTPASGTKDDAITLKARYLDPDADSGRLYFEIAGVGTWYDSVSNNSYGDYPVPVNNLAQGTYSWRVRAWDGSVYSAWTTYFTFTIVKKPAPPTNVTASTADAQATPEKSAKVSWSLSTNNGGAAIDYYTVKAYLASGAATTIAKTEWCSDGVCNETIVSGLADGTSYFFKVSAHNPTAGSGSESAASNTVTTPRKPGAPTNVRATAAFAAADVEWDLPDDGGRPPLSYTISVDNVTTGNPETPRSCADDCLTTRRHRVGELVPGQQYKFRVSATNVVDPGPNSADSNVVTIEPVITEQPVNIRATRGDGQAEVVWTPPTLAAPGLTQYDVRTYRTVRNASGVDEGSVFVKQAAPTTATSLTVDGLTNGEEYHFTVVTRNFVVTSNESVRSNRVIPAGTPFAPSGVTATRGDQSATVDWTGVDDNGDPVTSYTVTVHPADGSPEWTVSAADGPVKVGGLTNGASYGLSVQAWNSVGPGASSARVSAVPAGVPFAPTGVSAAKGDTTASVRWDAPDGNGSPVTKYTVTAEPGGLTKTTDGAETSMAFTGLQNGQSYAFTVAAHNAVGIGTASGSSNPVVPSGLPGPPTNVISLDGDKDEIQVGWAPAEPNGDSIDNYHATATLIEDPSVVYHFDVPNPARYDNTVNDTYATFWLQPAHQGKGFRFTVSATNANGTTNAAPVLSLTGPLAEVPTRPAVTAVSGPGGNGTATVSWSAPQQRAGSVTGYRVTAHSASGGPSVTKTVNDPNARQAALDKLHTGPYLFEVVALSDLGESDPSAPWATGGVPAPKYLALGDSYASGELNDPYESDDKCHRSDKRAYPEFATAETPYDTRFVACSGGQTKHFGPADDPNAEQQNGTEPFQLDRIQGDENVITITIGGNDIGFGDIVKDCTFSACGNDDAAPKIEEIRRLKGTLITKYDQVQSRAPKAKVLVVTYPLALTNVGRTNDCDDDKGFDNGERDYGNQVIRELNTVIREAAAVAGVEVVEVEDAFKDHEICTPDPWIGAFKLPPEAYHPKAEGQAVFARRVRSQMATVHPTVTAVSPATTVAQPSVCAAARQVTVKGTGFTENAEVWFGPTKAATTHVSSTELRATAPSGPAGVVDVRVSANEGLRWGMSPLSSAAKYTYAKDAVVPVTKASLDPAANADGWNRGGTTVTLTATDQTCADDVVSITYEAVGNDGGKTIQRTTVQGKSVSINVDEAGITLLRYWATDTSGNVEAVRKTTVGIDRRGPDAFIDGAEHQTRFQGEPIVGGATDNLSGVKTTTVRLTDTTGGVQDHVATCVAGCGTRSARWSLSTSGIAPGTYTVTAWSDDRAGNTGPPSWSVAVAVV